MMILDWLQRRDSELSFDTLHTKIWLVAEKSHLEETSIYAYGSIFARFHFISKLYQVHWSSLLLFFSSPRAECIARGNSTVGTA